MARSLVDDLYTKLVNEEDARVCREIPDTACREVPRNFFLLSASSAVTTLADGNRRTDSVAVCNSVIGGGLEPVTGP